MPLWVPGKTVPAVPVPLSVPGRTVLTVLVPSSGWVPGPPCLHSWRVDFSHEVL